MVILTDVAPLNDYTIYFKHPPLKPNYIRLISCSLYNSWDNLKRNSTVSLFDYNQKKPKSLMVLQGHYILKTIAKEIENVFSGLGLHLQTEMNQPVVQKIIDNPDNIKIVLGGDLSALLGIESKLLFKTFVKRLRSPSTYFIHCDLVDKEQNLLNGSPSSVLARFHIKGDPYEKMNYQQRKIMSYATPQLVNM